MRVRQHTPADFGFAFGLLGFTQLDDRIWQEESLLTLQIVRITPIHRHMFYRVQDYETMSALHAAKALIFTWLQRIPTQDLIRLIETLHVELTTDVLMFLDNEVEKAFRKAPPCESTRKAFLNLASALRTRRLELADCFSQNKMRIMQAEDAIMFAILQSRRLNWSFETRYEVGGALIANDELHFVVRAGLLAEYRQASELFSKLVDDLNALKQGQSLAFDHAAWVAAVYPPAPQQPVTSRPATTQPRGRKRKATTSTAQPRMTRQRTMPTVPTAAATRPRRHANQPRPNYGPAPPLGLRR